MYKFLATTCAIFALVTASPLPANAQTYVIPFSEIRQAIESSGDSPDAVIRARLAALIRSELDALGFDVNSGMVFADIPVEAMTEIIETGCNFPRPYEVHTDATTATVTIDDSSGLTLNLDSLQTINLLADLTGAVTTQATAWVRWGQDIPFGKDCAKINTDHGTVGIALPFDINLDLALQLNPSYDSELIAIVVDKHAMLQGTAIIGNGQLQHDFGGLSITDVVLDIFESELLLALQTNGEQAVADAITDLNYRLDGLDSNGQPDPTLTVFNSPTTFILDVSAQDQAFVKDLLAQYGIPDIVIAMLEERGVEVLIQLAVLEGAEREAYLASLGATITCDVTLAAFQTQLDSVPLYTLNNDVCEVTSLSGPAADSYYTDALCTDAVAYRVRDDAEFCLAYFDDQAETILGNAAAWEADNDQVNDALPAVPSRAWTTVASTQLDLGVASMSGNLLPYMKQVNYKTIDGISRGTGRCELEMRVYKNDIAEQNLRPLLALHGGTWRHRGSSFLGMEAGISHLTERGFIVFAPFYRLAGASDGNTECNDVSWREIVADAESALDWVQANGASLGAINEPVSVYGQSAGAHLSAWLASHRPNDVRKALLFYAPTDALAFLEGAVPLGGPYDAFRDFGLNSLSRLFGARGGSAELHLEYIDFADVTAEALREKWETLIPATVFDLSQVDPLNPPVYVERCATMTEIDLALINPAMPPEELTNCLKEDLRDFLIDNSFNHLLSDEAVPVHVVQGTADTLVPYEQALDLCGAIDGSVLPTTVTDPLTTYDCGTHSQVQLIQDAGHALELGVCLDSLCPAGPFGGEIRNAVETAINAAYAWLMQDASQPPPPPPPPVEEEEDRGGLGGMAWWSLLGLLMICWRRRSHQQQPANQAFFRSRSRTRGFSVASWFA